MLITISFPGCLQQSVRIYGFVELSEKFTSIIVGEEQVKPVFVLYNTNTNRNQ